MIKKNFNFWISFLQNSAIIELYENFLCCSYLDNKKRIKKFKYKSTNTKTLLFSFLKYNKNSFLNFNNTIFSTFKTKKYYKRLFNKKNKKIYLFRHKIKWLFKKFKYRGKGFKVKKFKRYSKITCRLGKSHWTKLIFNKKFIKIKRTKKNTYCLITINKNGIKKLKKYILLIRGVSKYTKRGIRLCRISFKKRFGKISQANSVYK